MAPQPPRRPGVRKTPTARKPTKPKAAPKPKAPKKPKLPARPSVAFQTLHKAHPNLWVGAFGTRTAWPGGFAAEVKRQIKPLTKGQTASWSVTAGREVLIGFVDRSDYDAVRLHFAGKPWRPPFTGLRGGFAVVL